MCLFIYLYFTNPHWSHPCLMSNSTFCIFSNYYGLIPADTNKVVSVHYVFIITSLKLKYWMRGGFHIKTKCVLSWAQVFTVLFLGLVGILHQDKGLLKKTLFKERRKTEGHILVPSQCHRCQGWNRPLVVFCWGFLAWSLSSEAKDFR